MVLVCLIHTFLCFMRCWYACLACFVPPVWLSLIFCIFLWLPTCSCKSLYFVLTSIQWNYGHLIQTYICPPRTPSFCLITCLFALSYASHVCLPPFGIFSQLVFSMLFPSICFFVYLVACFFCLCMYMHEEWSLGARVCPPRSKEKGKNARKKMQAHQGVVQ